MQAAVKEALPDSKHEKRTIVVWLDPIQQEIMQDKTLKKLVIIGPASTGKTILIQLKVLEIVTMTKDKVLIILPHEQLAAKYEKFFKTSDIGMNERIEFVTPDTKYRKHILNKNKNSNWFIDEFAALSTGHFDFCSQVLALSQNFSDKQFVWVTLDLQQQFEYFTKGFNHSGYFEDSIKRHLMFIHRCTGSVFNEYRENASPLIDMGHQIKVLLST
jgi:hypothetical protein